MKRMMEEMQYLRRGRERVQVEVSKGEHQPLDLSKGGAEEEQDVVEDYVNLFHNPVVRDQPERGRLEEWLKALYLNSSR